MISHIGINKEKSLKLPIVSCILYAFCAIFIGNGNLPTTISKVLLFFTTVIFIGRYPHYRTFKFFYVWNITTCLYFYLTLYWSVCYADTKSYCITYTLVVICNICLFYFLTLKYKFVDALIKTIIIATILLAIRVFFNYGFLNQGDRGAFEEVIGIHVNSVGLFSAIAMLFSYYYFKTVDRISRKKYLIAIIIFLIIIILSGSKKALIIPLIAFTIIKMCNADKKYIIFTIIGAILLSIFIYFLIMNVPFLYEHLGVRFEGMINGFSGSGEVDGSTKVRLGYIEYGMVLFKKKQIFGYGLATFAYLHTQVFGWGMYSHNNYVEMLVSGGIVGLVLYYSLYLYLIYKYYIIVKNTKDSFAILIFSILLGLMISQYGMVAYYNLFINIFLTLASAQLFWFNINQEYHKRKKF